jgi:uncharacterized membrane protein
LAFAADSTERQAKGHAILVHIPSQCYPAAASEFRLLDGWQFCYAPAHLQVWEGVMAFCSACGQEIGTALFCPKCGASQGTSTAPAAAVAAASPTAGLDENVAGLLCYILGWVSGLIFLLIDKRPFVKFHAAQSIAMSIAVFVLYFVLAIFMGLLHVVHLGFLAFMLYPLLGLALFVLWVFVMYKAYQYEKFKLPIIGNLVEGMVK